MLPSALVAGLAPALWSRQQLEDAYQQALQAAQESAHAAQVYRNRIRNTENYLLTVPDDCPLDELRRDLRALLVGGMS